MRKFTLLTSLMALFAISSMADTKIIYRDAFASDATKANWTNSRGGAANDATSFVTTTDGGYMQFGDGKTSFNGTRFSSIWGTTPWEGVTIPEDGYTMEFWFCFNKFGNDSGKANQRNNEIAIISATEATDENVNKALANYWGSAGTDYVKSETETIPIFKNYLFKLSHNPEGSAAGEGGYVGNGSCGFFINGGTDEVRIAEGTWYRVVLTVVGQNVSYAIVDSNETPLAGGSGVRTLNDGADNRAGGLLHYQARSYGITQIGLNLQVSYATTEAIANEPTVTLLAVKGNDRVYKAVFGEDEVLHYSFNGAEQTPIDYWDCEGQAEITVTESCLMEVWTTKSTATSSKVSQNVVCGWIKLVDPVVSITSVSAGFGKSYKVTFDAQAPQHLLAVEYGINYIIDGGAPVEISNGGTINMPNAGTLKVIVNQIPVAGQKYYTDSEVTINNDVEYAVAEEKTYNYTPAELEAMAAKFDKEDLGNSGKSQWERVYQAPGKDPGALEGRNAWGLWDGAAEKVCDIYKLKDEYQAELMAPLCAAETEQSGDRNQYKFFPYEGLVFHSIAYGNNHDLHIDTKYITDDAAKPNFYILSVTTQYDRPDKPAHDTQPGKGDGVYQTYVVKTDAVYSQYRFDNAISKVQVMTYKGFTPSTGIEAIKTVKTFNENAPIFNLNGVRVQNAAQKGIYIQNGKKFVVK